MGAAFRRVVVILCVAGLLAAPAIAASPDKPVRTNPWVMEWRASESANWMAWTERRSRRLGHAVFAKRDGGRKFQLPSFGFHQAITGGVSGKRLVYQTYDQGEDESKLHLYSLPQRERRSLPGSVNTRHWEYLPSLSGKWLLFARAKANRRVVMLANLQTGNTRVLDRARWRVDVEPGQVNGDYATWTVGGNGFEVYRYRISTRSKQRISRGDRWAYGGSVARDGTVYLVRSGEGCGKNVTVERWRGGRRKTLLRPAEGIDMFQTRVYQPPGGRKRILHERLNCKAGLDSSDVYRFTSG